MMRIKRHVEMRCDDAMDGGRNPEVSNHPFLLRRDLVRRIAKNVKKEITASFLPIFGKKDHFERSFRPVFLARFLATWILRTRLYRRS